MKSSLVKWTLIASLTTSAFGMSVVAPHAQTETAQATTTVFSMTSGVNVRSGPGTTYRVLGQLTFNDPLTVVRKYNSAWYEVYYKSNKAYVSASWVNLKPNVQAYYRVKANGYALNARGGPATKYRVLWQYKDGAIVPMLNKTTSNWYRVWKGGSTLGYVSAAYLTPLDASIVRTEGMKLNLRAGPSSKYKIIRKLERGTMVYVVHQNNARWTAIAYDNGKVGYVNAKYLERYPY